MVITIYYTDTYEEAPNAMETITVPESDSWSRTRVHFRRCDKRPERRTSNFGNPSISLRFEGDPRDVEAARQPQWCLAVETYQNVEGKGYGWYHTKGHYPLRQAANSREEYFEWLMENVMAVYVDKAPYWTNPDYAGTVRALSAEQIQDIAEAYANAAVLARRAGFQMCMVHAGHGWLINQFLSPYFNKRTDEYGGSLENRLRFARQILTAIREATGPGFPIELRMSGSELFEGGYDIEEGCKIAAGLEDLVDLIHVSAGSYQFGFSITHPSMFREHGCNVPLAARIKQHVSVPVIAIGGLSDPAQMEEIVSSGQADGVAMARALLADPELPNKVMANKGDEVIKCLRCFVCMAERPVTQTRRCAVNPLIGREFEGLDVALAACPGSTTHPPKRVLVAGGGIAGLKAAHTAAMRGHDVTLCEAGTELGGILRTEAAIPFKHEMYELGRTYALLCERAGVNIQLGQKVDAAFCEQFNPDALIVAVGSEPIPAPFTVEDGARLISIEELYLDGVETGPEVAVVGGGLSGCECALYLARKGVKVHLIEMRDELAPDANIRNRPILLAEIDGEKINGEAAIDVITSAKVVGAKAEGVTVEKLGGQAPSGNSLDTPTMDTRGAMISSPSSESFIPCQSVVVAIGQRSRTADVEDLRDGAPFVRVIGDALRPANITLAIYEAYHAALDI